MADTKRVVGLVLARGGSKGILHKNRRILAGRPMLSWVLRPMQHCKLIDEIWVSTDDDQTAEIARAEGANVFTRGVCCATDDASSVSAVDEFLREKNTSFDVVALVQCTSPCLHPCYLDEAIELVLNGSYDSVFSVTRDFKWRWTELAPADGTSRPLNFDPALRLCRQHWSGEIVESGHFYVTRSRLACEGLLQGGRCGYVEMPSHLCGEVDSDEDVTLAELRLAKHGYRGPQASTDVELVLDAPTEFHYRHCTSR
ncbi:N-acylneuraminate cytidylyltransferase A-like isoform X1 [Varroa jacobsoni]|uniref:N-acylneuraminate cytidylyltransferase n=1 Tax=Varroa destructor TaxID=109461 RepID=A0A7M7KKU2_VARDE|nr:N-acylneuraminate cytidylyltransferase A-like isoform X2 [Varroa destructor]XP_022689149.1 N-acylneuraminate cytidylyltransferase A-like isoform X1 [Varroa jacobsoni]